MHVATEKQINNCGIFPMILGKKNNNKHETFERF